MWKKILHSWRSSPGTLDSRPLRTNPNTWRRTRYWQRDRRLSNLNDVYLVFSFVRFFASWTRCCACDCEWDAGGVNAARHDTAPADAKCERSSRRRERRSHPSKLTVGKNTRAPRSLVDSCDGYIAANVCGDSDARCMRVTRASANLSQIDCFRRTWLLWAGPALPSAAH